MAQSLALLHGPLLGTRQFSESDDPRTGSARENSTGGTLSHLNGGTTSASLASLGSTFAPVGIYSAICLLIFILLRRKHPQAYAPRSIPGIRPPELGGLSPVLPSGWFNWIKPFFQIPESFILHHCSLDAFLFLRFLKVLGTICLVGCCSSWFILLPIHGTGGNGLAQLDLLTIGNIENSIKFFAHVAVAWVFFGFILFMISRECMYFIGLRQAYMLSPERAHLVSSRTVLFTCVPKHFLNERRLRKLFGDTVRHVWVAKDTSILRSLVAEREEEAIRLEEAEIELIMKANASRTKQLKLTSDPPKPLRSRLHGLSLRGPGRKQHVTLELESTTGKSPDEVRVLSRSTTISPPNSPLSNLTPTIPPFEFEKPPSTPSDEYTHPYGLHSSLPDIRGSVAALYIPQESRPTHRPIANLLQSVDTIRWSRARLKTLNSQIGKLRKRHRAGEGTPLSAAFIEFDTQADAQAAYQILPHHAPLHMTPRFIGLRPQDVVWSALRMKWWERIMRRFLMMGVIAAAVIFWSIPSALVGSMSNIKFLSEKIFFLAWIPSLPGPILGIIQGLLPALALSLLMAAVPWMLRACAFAAGVASLPQVELYVQSSYFVFQVVQVFLVTTLTSAASAAFTEILQNPLSAKDLLSQNLPKASNFYLSYITVQCLAGGAWNLAHVLSFVREKMGPGIRVPRKRWMLWRRMRRICWGHVYPVFTNMGVIAISYACIAPLILAFAGIGMIITYTVYRYNLIYTYASDVDTKGLLYPRALMHLMTGLYLAEICLIGLFALQTAIGPLLMMVMFLVFTVLVHLSLHDALAPYLTNLPRTLALEDEDLAKAGDSEDEDDDQVAGQGHAQEIRPEPEGGAAAEYYNMEEGLDSPSPEAGAAADYYNINDPDLPGGAPEATTNNTSPNNNTNNPHNTNPPTTTTNNPTTRDSLDDDDPGADITRGIALDGTTGLALILKQYLLSRSKAQLKSDTSSLSRLTARLFKWSRPRKNPAKPDEDPGILSRWLHPEIYEDFFHLRETMVLPPISPPTDSASGEEGFRTPQQEAEEKEEFERAQAAEHVRRGYWPPEMWTPQPRMWIPRDEGRVSRQEVAHSRGVIVASDRGAWIEEGGRVRVEMESCPLREMYVIY